MNFVVPVPSETFDVALEDGASIRIRRHGNRDGLRLAVTHGNGFAADAYLPFWQLLTPSYDVLVFDFRNHGQNVPVEPSNHNYGQLARDLDRVLDAIEARLGKKTTVGVFHSMSARTAMKHAIEIGWRWQGLVLFDPPNVPPVNHPRYAAMEAFENKLAEWALGRRRRFAAVEELTADYLKSRATERWVPGAHELMARSVLRKSPDGFGYTLVCTPENEAAIYAEALTLNLWPRANAFGGPVRLIGADPNMKGGPATALTNQALGLENGYDYAFVPGTGHLLQIEQPADCARTVEEFIARWALRLA
ncbi:MAG TPA: alpha/beta hydrolase [Xanthobacteraceae bacterium]|jgi:pimeloyl-ACP methyl ester carboxylesterase